MTWILIIVVLAGDGRHVTRQEIGTEASCRLAEERVTRAPYVPFLHVHALCVPRQS